jgi:hypothetical protein
MDENTHRLFIHNSGPVIINTEEWHVVACCHIKGDMIRVWERGNTAVVEGLSGGNKTALYAGKSIVDTILRVRELLGLSDSPGSVVANAISQLPAVPI